MLGKVRWSVKPCVELLLWVSPSAELRLYISGPGELWSSFFLLMRSLRIYYDWWHLKMETLPRWTFPVLLVRLNISEYVKWKWNYSSGYFDFMGSKFHLRSVIYKLGITFPLIFSQIYVVPVTTYFSYISYIITRKGHGLLLATNA